MTRRIMPFLFICIFIFGITSCEERKRMLQDLSEQGDFDWDSYVEEPVMSSKNEILSFSIEGQLESVIDKEDDSIYVLMPADTDLRSLLPVISIDGEKIVQASYEEQDFRDPINYVVIAEDGGTRQYLVSVDSESLDTDFEPVILSDEKEILSFIIEGQVSSTVIEGSNIHITVPHDRDLSSLIPYIEIRGVGISPESGVARNFSGPATYVVMAEDGSSKQYTVRVDLEIPEVEEPEELHFAIGDTGPAGGVIFISPDTPGNSTGLYFEAATSNAPSFLPWQDPDEVLIGSSAQGTAIGTGRDNTTAIVTWLRANGQTSNRAALYCDNYSQGGYSDWFLPSRDELVHIDGLTVGWHWTSSESSNTHAVVQQGASRSQGSLRKFNAVRVRCVRAIEAPALSDEKEIISFNIEGQISATRIQGNNIYITMPYGTMLNSLKPSIAINGLIVIPQSGVATDFRSAVTYTVTASDKSVRTYSVHVDTASFGFNIGDTGPSGGIVFITPNTPGNDTGLYFEVASSDGWHRGHSWQNPSVLIGNSAQGEAIGTGKGNSTAIVNWLVRHGQTSGRAALHCNRFSQGGYSDWFLPSKDELHQIYLRRDYIGEFGPMYWYWSSTEHMGGHFLAPRSAWVQNPNNGQTGTYMRGNEAGVRCIRSFSINNSQKDIEFFNINGQIGESLIDGNDIHLTMPYEANISSLAPGIIINGASLSPLSGVARDFRNPVTYTVTASDGSTKQYTVRVNVEERGAYIVGDTGPSGGTIFITPNTPGNDTGLYFEAATADASSRLAWQNPHKPLIGSSVQGISIGTGKGNSAEVAKWLRANGETSNRAVIYCDEYSQGGHNDWFLPSKHELHQMYLHRNTIGGFVRTENVVCCDSYYWSSSENPYLHGAGNSSAEYQIFSSLGLQGNLYKSYDLNVRCVRSFK